MLLGALSSVAVPWAPQLPLVAPEFHRLQPFYSSSFSHLRAAFLGHTALLHLGLQGAKAEGQSMALPKQPVDI